MLAGVCLSEGAGPGEMHMRWAPTACASHAHPLPCHLHDLISLSSGASQWFALLPQVGSWSRVLEDAVRSLINDHGVTVVVASGNSGVDACYVAPGEALCKAGVA